MIGSEAELIYAGAVGAIACIAQERAYTQGWRDRIHLRLPDQAVNPGLTAAYNSGWEEAGWAIKMRRNVQWSSKSAPG